MEKCKKGRPPKFDAARAAKVCEAVRAGAPRADAAAYAGIGERTLSRWVGAGRRAKKGAFWRFWQDVKKAESDAVVRNVAVIQKAAETQWQAAAWWLERRRPEEFSRKERREISGPGGGPVAVRLELVEEIVDAPGAGRDDGKGREC